MELDQTEYIWIEYNCMVLLVPTRDHNHFKDLEKESFSRDIHPDDVSCINSIRRNDLSGHIFQSFSWVVDHYKN